MKNLKQIADTLSVRSKFLDADTEEIRYEVEFVDFDFRVVVPMPALAVFIHIDSQEAGFRPDLHKEHAEFYIDRYQLRAIDALAYALVSNELPQYEELRSEARDWWQSIEKAGAA